MAEHTTTRSETPPSPLPLLPQTEEASSGESSGSRADSRKSEARRDWLRGHTNTDAARKRGIMRTDLIMKYKLLHLDANVRFPKKIEKSDVEQRSY